MSKIKIPCFVCGTTVERWPSRKTYCKTAVCSKKCLGIKMAELYKKNRIEKKCEECGNTFLVAPSKNKQGMSKFCSAPCRCKYVSRKTKGVRRKQNNIIDKSSHYEMRIKRNKKILFVLFDREDLELVNKYTWFIGSHGYACAHIAGSREMILMHRLIAKTPIDLDTDHRNHNTLDNRKSNIRVCTTSQNMINIDIGEGKKYKGVHKSRNNTFYAKNANIHLGTFATPELAAQAYNEAVKARYGEFAQLNKI